MVALKAVMKALKVDFKTEKTTYSPEFVAKMNQSEEDITAGRITKIAPADVFTAPFQPVVSHDNSCNYSPAISSSIFSN